MPAFRSSCVAVLPVVAVLAVAAAPVARAGVIPVTSYDMNNGNGVIQNGGHDYFDSTYSIPTFANTNGSSLVVPSNASPHEAPLSGGTGKLTDGVIPSQNYSFTYANYVGWKYQDPTLTFHLAAGASVRSVSLYVASSYAGTLGFLGLVGQPSSVNVSITTPGNTTFAPTYSTTFADYLSDVYSGTEIITLTFAQPIASANAFSLTLNRGPLLLDGINYYNSHVAPAVNNPNGCGADGCYLDTVNDFTNSAYIPNLEPWIMLSEVQFMAAVPEPATWAMMMLGFAGLGFMGWRAKRKPASA